MSWQYRTYLGVLVARHFTIAALLLRDTERFQGGVSFEVLFALLSPGVWAALLLFSGVGALVAAVIGSQWGARLNAVMAVGISVAWAAAFAIAHFRDQDSSLLLVVLLGGLGLKDLVFAGMVEGPPLEAAGGL